jgi:hypothetical protein
VYRSPIRIKIGPDGLLWATNPAKHKLQSYDLAGGLRASWGKPSSDWDGFSSCCNPVSFAWLPDGRWVTAEKQFPRVKVSKADGTFECAVAGPEAFDERNHALDVAVNRAGQILVLDPVRRTVRFFERKGE